MLTIFCLAALLTGFVYLNSTNDSLISNELTTTFRNNCSEVLDTAVITWHRMRGTQMIAAVKIISIGFDIDRKKIRNFPNFIEFWGYILCPGNVIMGPWCAYNDYLYLFNQSKFVSIKSFMKFSLSISNRLQNNILFFQNQSFIWIFHVLVNAFIAVFFLLASNCYIEAYVPSLHFRYELNSFFLLIQFNLFRFISS